MGSDTGGSVRVPAGRSGVAGLKPTYGLISRCGVINNSFSFDHCGPLAWTVEDCALMLQAVAGFDAKDPGSAERPVPDYAAAFVPDLKGWRIGVVRHFWEEDLPASDEERAAMDTALDVLRELGATLEDVRLRSLQEYFDVKIIVAESEIHSVHQRDLQERPGDFGADFMGKILLASPVLRLGLRAGAAHPPAHARGDGADLCALRRSGHRRNVAGAKVLGRAHHRFLGKAEHDDAVQRHRGAGAVAVQRLHQERVADVDAGRRPALRRDQDAAGGLRLRARHRVATARPNLVPGTAKVPAGPSTDNPTDPSRYDARTRQLVEFLLARHGLTKVSDAHVAQLCEAVPYGLAMAERVRRGLRREDEPAHSFRFPRSTVWP